MDVAMVEPDDVIGPNWSESMFLWQPNLPIRIELVGNHLKASYMKSVYQTFQTFNMTHLFLLKHLNGQFLS